MKYFEVSLSASPQSLEERFSAVLDQLYQSCTDRYVFLSEKFNLPQAEARTLFIFGSQRYLTPKGVSISLGVSRSRVTKIVDGLVEKGYLRKAPDPTDSRVTLLALTPAGLKIRKAFSQAKQSLRDQLLNRIEPDKREVIMDSLETLNATMVVLADELEQPFRERDVVHP